MNGFIHADKNMKDQAISSNSEDMRSGMKETNWGITEIKNETVTNVTVTRFLLFIAEFAFIHAKISKVELTITSEMHGRALNAQIIA